MAFNLDKDDIKKPKLPRKRKKAAIKLQGRKWYLDTIKLYKITSMNRMFREPICKFWVNSEVKTQPHIFNNDKVKLVPTPTKYW